MCKERKEEEGKKDGGRQQIGPIRSKEEGRRSKDEGNEGRKDGRKGKRKERKMEGRNRLGQGRKQKDGKEGMEK